MTSGNLIQVLILLEVLSAPNLSANVVINEAGSKGLIFLGPSTLMGSIYAKKDDELSGY